MCTLIIGVDVLAPGAVILAGNRDEDPERPSRGPGILVESPRVAGGADAVAGGTWLAVRERRAAVAMLNRWHDGAPAPLEPGLRSRGRLTLDLAAADAGSGLAAGARRTARAALERDRYAPFSAVFAAPSGSWMLAHRGGGSPPEISVIGPGWHVLTHRELDDPDEPRADFLVRTLRAWRPRQVDEARAGLMALLASHEPPRACIHEGRMVTVSSFVVSLARDGAHYHHLDGRPCEREPVDRSDLLDGAFDDGD